MNMSICLYVYGCPCVCESVFDFPGNFNDHNCVCVCFPRLQVVSSQPRAFIIEDFLNAFEAETIIKYAQPKVEDSTIG